MTHQHYLHRCFQLARLGAGKAAPNPMVGSVVVYNNVIIGEGFHQQYGGPHAEVNAINSIDPKNLHLLKEATIYVSLEPCFHFGKTPPCVNLILEKGIKKVVISCTDPNPKVAGKSIEKLKANGVDVISGILEQEGQALAKRFFTFFQKKRPYIILKYAQSLDGYISKKDQQVWITSPTSKKLVHKWRSEEAAILVGTHTVQVDNPKLTNRLWSGNSPVRITIDNQLHKLKDHVHILNKEAPTYIFNTLKNETLNHQNFLVKYNSKQPLPLQITDFLYQKKLNSLIVEGGRHTLQHFIDLGLWDEARVFVGNKTLGSGILAPNLTHGEVVEEKTITTDRLMFFKNKN